MPINETYIGLFSPSLALLAGLVFGLAVLFCLGNIPQPAMAAPLPRTLAVVSNVTASTPTTTTLISSPDSSAVGQTITLTAMVRTPPGLIMICPRNTLRNSPICL